MSFTDPLYLEAEWSPPDSLAYGPLVSAFEVEYALAGAIREYMDLYLRETERQRQLESGSLPEFRSIVSSPTEASGLPQAQLPAVQIVAWGVRDRPTVQGDGTITARWRTDCTCYCAARGNYEARKLANLYLSAVRALLLQHQKLQPTNLEVMGIDWFGERYNVLDATDQRTIAGAAGEFRVQVANVTNRMAKPGESHWGESVDVRLEKKEIRVDRPTVREDGE